MMVELLETLYLPKQYKKINTIQRNQMDTKAIVDKK
jgi:hypothetical protein